MGLPGLFGQKVERDAEAVTARKRAGVAGEIVNRDHGSHLGPATAPLNSVPKQPSPSPPKPQGPLACLRPRGHGFFRPRVRPQRRRTRGTKAPNLTSSPPSCIAREGGLMKVMRVRRMQSTQLNSRCGKATTWPKGALAKKASPPMVTGRAIIATTCDAVHGSAALPPSLPHVESQRGCCGPE